MTTKIFDTREQQIKEKEIMRKKIAEALAADIHKVTNVPLSKEFCLTKSMNNKNEFIIRFRELGGKYIPSSRASFVNDMKRIIQNKHYGTVLNTSKYLSGVLKQYQIPYTEALSFMIESDVAIVYADAMLAASGSLFISNMNSYYPSVKNLSKNLLVIAFEEHIVATVSEAMALSQQNDIDKKGSIYEIVTPTKLASYDDYTSKEPLIILLLIQKDVAHA